MTRSELCAHITARSSLSKADVAAALGALTPTIADGPAECETLTVAGFATFAASTRAARHGRNPAPPSPSPSRRPGALLRGRKAPSRCTQPAASQVWWKPTRL